MNYRPRLAYLLALSPLLAGGEVLEEPILMEPIEVITFECSSSYYGAEGYSCVNFDIGEGYSTYEKVVVNGPGPVIADAEPAAVSLTANDLNVTLDADIVSALENAHGLLIDDPVSGATVTVNGNITTENDAVSAIKIGDNTENNVIVLAGDIISPISDTAYAIDVNGTNNTISIGKSAIVEGAIKFTGTGHSLAINKDKADSYMYTVEGGNAYNIVDASKDNSKFVVKGSANSRSIADIKDTTHRLYERFGSVNSALAAHYGEDQSRMWTDGYYHKTEREIVGDEVKHEGYGVNAGYHLFDKGRPWDLTVNAEFSETKYGQAIDGNEPHTAESKSVLVGLTTPEIYKPKFGTMSLTLLAGIESVESELLVANNMVAGGVETVSDDYNSIYLVAGSKWLGTMSKDKVAHDIALGVDLIHERTASHDASAHFTMHERNLTQLNASASYQLSIASSGKSSIYGGGEVNYAKLIQGEDQEFTIKGQTANTKLTHTDDKESESYYKGVLGLALNPSETSHFYVSAQMLNSNVDIDGYGVSLGFKTTK